MKLISRRAVLALTLACAAIHPALASDERGSKDEAKSMCDAAVAHIKKVGPEKAYKDFVEDKATWVKKDLYVMVYDGKGVAMSHGANPKLIGKDLSALKDANGTPIIAGLVALAAKGGGWFDYEWPDPVTKKVMGKSTFAKAQPSGDGFVGVGVYR